MLVYIFEANIVNRFLLEYHDWLQSLLFLVDLVWHLVNPFICQNYESKETTVLKARLVLILIMRICTIRRRADELLINK